MSITKYELTSEDAVKKLVRVITVPILVLGTAIITEYKFTEEDLWVLPYVSKISDKDGLSETDHQQWAEYLECVSQH